MNTTELTIGQRVAKSENRLGYKVGTIKNVKGNLALVDFDNHANRWVSINNLEVVK